MNFVRFSQFPGASFEMFLEAIVVTETIFFLWTNSVPIKKFCSEIFKC